MALYNRRGVRLAQLIPWVKFEQNFPSSAVVKHKSAQSADLNLIFLFPNIYHYIRYRGCFPRIAIQDEKTWSL